MKSKDETMQRIGRINVPDELWEQLIKNLVSYCAKTTLRVAEETYGIDLSKERNNVDFLISDDYLRERIIDLIREQTDNKNKYDKDIEMSEDFRLIDSAAFSAAKAITARCLKPGGYLKSIFEEKFIHV